MFRPWLHALLPQSVGIFRVHHKRAVLNDLATPGQTEKAVADQADVVGGVCAPGVGKGEEKCMSATIEGQKPGFGSIARQGAQGGILATVINAILFTVGSALGAFPPEALTPMGPPVDITAILGISVAATVAAIVGYFVLTRIASLQRANQILVILAVLVLVGMAFNPLGIVNAPVLQIVLLEVMHIVLGGGLVYFLLKS